MSEPRATSRFRTVEISDPRFETDGVRTVTAKSRHLGGRGDVTLHIPTAARGRSGVPIVVLLHGIYSSHWAWVMKGGAHRTNERLSASGGIVPMILAMPSDGLWGDGSGYARHAAADFESWIVEDVPALVREVVPETSADSPVYIAGLSMGGFGALWLGARHPDVFSAISAHSAATHLDQLSAGVEESLAADGVRVAEGSALGALLACRSRPPLRFDCGVEDFLLEPNRQLHEGLRAADINHVYEEHPGGHTWSYWERHLPETLRFFSAVDGG